MLLDAAPTSTISHDIVHGLQSSVAHTSADYHHQWHIHHIWAQVPTECPLHLASYMQQRIILINDIKVDLHILIAIRPIVFHSRQQLSFVFIPSNTYTLSCHLTTVIVGFHTIVFGICWKFDASIDIQLIDKIIFQSILCNQLLYDWSTINRYTVN